MGTASGRIGRRQKRITGSVIGRLPVDQMNLIYAFYDGSFLIFFSVCVSRSYDAFFFYHKAYAKNVLFVFF